MIFYPIIEGSGNWPTNTFVLCDDQY